MKTARKKRWRWWLLAFCLFFLIFLVSAELTSRSSFCSVCHYMKPFYESWKISSHNQIECQICHYPPGLRSKFRAKIEGLLQVGRYWTKLYLKSKPWAEIPDEACLRPGCHDKRLLEGEVKFKTVIFDHKIHFEDLRRGKKLRCTSCHSQIVQGEHITVTESTCFICHFKKSEHYPRIADCFHCHKSEDLRASKARHDHEVALKNNLPCQRCHAQVIVGDGVVPKENCYKCHFERDRLDRYDETDLMHSTHITDHKIECNQCHLEIQHKIIREIETIADCRTCHQDFHQAQKILYQGRGGKGEAHPLPSIKLEKGLSCQACHVLHEKTKAKSVVGQTLEASGQACEACHGQGFSRLLAQWKKAAEKEVSTVRQALLQAEKEIGRSQASQNDREQAKRLLAEAAFNLEVVAKGKAVHNMAFSLELLRAASKLINEAMELAGAKYKAPVVGELANRVSPACSQCHQGIEAMEGEAFGHTFNHGQHLERTTLACESCHRLSPRHGQLIVTRSDCASCHHESGPKNCADCHSTQKIIYQGGNLSGLEFKPDSMAEAGVDCQNCHSLEKGRIVRSDRASCLECHEEEYWQILQEKQKEIRDKSKQLTEIFKQVMGLELSAEEKNMLEKDRQIFNRIQLDRSLGAHNFSQIDSWLTDCLEKWLARLAQKDKIN